jgi:hypothetical protein
MNRQTQVSWPFASDETTMYPHHECALPHRESRIPVQGDQTSQATRTNATGPAENKAAVTAKKPGFVAICAKANALYAGGDQERRNLGGGYGESSRKAGFVNT